MHSYSKSQSTESKTPKAPWHETMPTVDFYVKFDKRTEFDVVRRVCQEIKSGMPRHRLRFWIKSREGVVIFTILATAGESRLYTGLRDKPRLFPREALNAVFPHQPQSRAETQALLVKGRVAAAAKAKADKNAARLDAYTASTSWRDAVTKAVNEAEKKTKCVQGATTAMPKVAWQGVTENRSMQSIDSYPRLSSKTPAPPTWVTRPTPTPTPAPPVPTWATRPTPAPTPVPTKFPTSDGGWGNDVDDWT